MKKKSEHGFTMVEVMIVMAVLAILATFAIPAYMSWRPNFHLKGAARDLLSNFQKAKIQAVKNRTNCVIDFSGGGGYTLFLDADEDFTLDTADETTILEVNWAENYKGSLTSISDNFDASTNNAIAFQTRGLPEKQDGIGGGTVTLQNTNGKQLRVIISDTGAIRISEMEDAP
jgi:type IV fimbrial biogenesis protein FimT